MEIIRLDMGSPDMPPAPFIIEALIKEAKRDNTHGYAPYGGTTAFKQAVASYYQSRFGVELDPSREVLGLIGSREGIFNLTQAIVNPGIGCWCQIRDTQPTRPAAKLPGRNVHFMPLLEENGFLPDLDAIPAGGYKICPHHVDKLSKQSDRSNCLPGGSDTDGRFRQGARHPHCP